MADTHDTTRPPRRKNGIPADLRDELDRRPDESEADHKRRYQRAIQKRWRQQNKEKEAARRRELYRLNGQGDAKKAWNAANKEKTAKYSRAHFEAHRDKRIAKLKEWCANNPDHFKKAKADWFRRNRHKYTFYHAKRRADAAMAMPMWVNWKEIEKFYTLAKKLTKRTGIEHQVDHIVPLNGKTVRGLHVPWNLQVITKAANIAKSNKLDHL